MANATVALNFLQESVQQYGFTYVSSNGTGFAVTREAVCLISAVAIAAITAIGCCCTRLCTKPAIHNAYNLNTIPPVRVKRENEPTTKNQGYSKYLPSWETIGSYLLYFSIAAGAISRANDLRNIFKTNLK
ncbi:MAG: hypothetical protein WCT85_02025 [Parachlamydiales bacterium]|jgi:hypothetical protein